jgi:hypothetical protein
MGLDVLHAVSLELHYLTAASDQGHRAGEVVSFEVAFDVIIDSTETLARHPDVFWSRGREFPASDDQAHGNGEDDQDRDCESLHETSRRKC